MPENECPINGITCVSITRVEALERAMERDHEERSRAHEKIYARLGELERGMTAVTTQYSQIISQLATMSADINALKDTPRRRWDIVIAAILTGVVGYLLARFGVR